MRALLLPLVMLTACGEKTPPVAAADAAEAPVAEAAAEPEPEPEPVEAGPPPPPPSNVDFSIAITYADGTTKAGKVRRLERSTDLYGEEGWTDEASKLIVYGEQGATAKEFNFTDLDLVTIKPGTIPADVSCLYDSNWTPWMYDCTLKTASKATLKDGSSWDVTTRQKWKLTFADDTETELWLYKYPVREQDEDTVTLDTVNPENYDLYTKLQQQLREDVKTKVVIKVDLQ